MIKYRREREQGMQEGKKFWLSERVIAVCPGTYSKCMEWICYDVQCEVLEVKLKKEVRARRHFHVPEEIWYEFQRNPSPDLYYHCYICGHYPEQDKGESRKGSDIKNP